MFNDNDIESLLSYTDNNQSGSYNQLQWSVNTGNDATDIVSRVISIHEFLHNELNNITGYGFLLQGYAYLSREKSEHQQFYTKTLHQLVSRCRAAHEAYATWLSITVFKKDLHDTFPETVLEGNTQYLHYFNTAEYLVKHINSIFLKQQVVSACMRFCFQSATIVNTASNNLATFSFSSVKNSEFPDKRFQYLLEKLPEHFLINCVQEFINNIDEKTDYQLLTDAFNGNENANVLMAMENDHLSKRLMLHIYTKLQQHFDSLDSASIEDNEHLHFFEKLLTQLDLLCPFANSKNPLYLNKSPDDFDRSMILNFENETLMLSESPLPCVVLFVEEVNQETKEQIIKGVGVEPHLFITSRYSLFLKEQYQFKYEEDQEWFENSNTPFTAIRYAGNVDGERIVFYIIFKNPDELIDFLKDKPHDVPMYGCIAISAAYHQEWWALWGNFFVEKCTSSCLLTDISPLYYIENVFPTDESVSYAKMVIQIEGITRTAMIFQIKEANTIKVLMVAPCSDMYCQVIHHYIKTRYPSFTNDVPLTEVQYKNLPIILSHVLREEHTYYYRSQETNLI
ncbi:MAG: hypothetical protein MUF58_12965 [Arcicella sp.]|jgi:hypothetical protein|nr:hypothetical protein [Arcicella sp.]